MKIVKKIYSEMAHNTVIIGLVMNGDLQSWRKYIKARNW